MELHDHSRINARSLPRWALPVLAALVTVPALWHLVTLTRVMAARLMYPMDLEWMEGAGLYQAHRFIEGEPVFGPATQGYVPFGYGPLHSLVVAAVGQLVGLDYWSGRLVSILSILAALGVMFWQLYRCGGRNVRGLILGVLGIGAAAAAQHTTDGWFVTWMRLMSKHDIHIGQIDDAIISLITFAPYLLVIPALAAVLWRWQALSAQSITWTGMLLAVTPGATAAFLKEGGWVNNFTPIVFLCGPVFLMLAHDMSNATRESDGRTKSRLIPLSEIVAVGVISVVLVTHRYDPSSYIPNKDQRSYALKINEYLAGSAPEGVLVPQHPFLAVRNGHEQAQMHEFAHVDAVKAGVAHSDVAYFLESSTPRMILTHQSYDFYPGSIIESMGNNSYMPIRQFASEGRGMVSGFETGALTLYEQHRAQTTHGSG